MIENAKKTSFSVGPQYTPLTHLVDLYLNYLKKKSIVIIIASYLAWLVENRNLTRRPSPSFTLITWDTWGETLAWTVLNNLDEIFLGMMNLIHPGISPPRPPNPSISTNTRSGPLFPDATENDRSRILWTYEAYLRSAVEQYILDGNIDPVHKAVKNPDYTKMKVIEG